MVDPAPLSGRQPKAVRNAFAVLEEVVAAGPGVTAKEISAALKMPPATTYRLLNLLVGEEYLVRLPDLRGFALGRRVRRLSIPLTSKPCAAARGVVEHVRQQLRWAVHLASYTSGRVVLTDPDPDHPPSDEVLLARFPHASALGKLLLAEQPDWRALVRDLRSFTERTRTEPAQLDSELAEVARTGTAQQLGELWPDRGCLAVAIRDENDALVGGLTVSGPSTGIAERNDELITMLEQHARQLGPLLA